MNEYTKFVRKIIIENDTTIKNVANGIGMSFNSLRMKLSRDSLDFETILSILRYLGINPTAALVKFNIISNKELLEYLYEDLNQLFNIENQITKESENLLNNLANISEIIDDAEVKISEIVELGNLARTSQKKRSLKVKELLDKMGTEIQEEELPWAAAERPDEKKKAIYLNDDDDDDFEPA